ncbi:MAG: rRNA adenine N-6-methyltransferase family protein [Saprospiraceae bacterium]
MGHRDSFISQSLKNIRTIEPEQRISPYMCKEIIKQWSGKGSIVILELNAGEGSISKQILKKLNPDSRLISLEADVTFCKILREINDNRHTVIQVDVLDSNFALTSLPIGQVDIIISAVPFMHSSEEQITKIVQDSYDRLTDDGKFIQVQYSSAAKKLYEKILGVVQIKFLPFNVPPAFLFIMNKSINQRIEINDKSGKS